MANYELLVEDFADSLSKFGENSFSFQRELKILIISTDNQVAILIKKLEVIINLNVIRNRIVESLASTSVKNRSFSGHSGCHTR